MTEFMSWVVNYLLFPFELLAACVLYMLPLRRRKGFLLRLIVGAVICLGVAGFIPRSLLRYLLEFILAALFVWLCCELPLCDILYCAVCAYATQHLAYSVHALIYQLLGSPSGWYYWLKPVIYGGVYLLFYWFIARRLPEKGGYGATWGQSLLSMLLILSFTILVSHYVNSQVLAGNSAPAYLYACRLYAILCCFFALWMQMIWQKRSRLQRELELKDRLWYQERTQYDLAKENIALINQKCHDLKHQISALEQPGQDGERSRYLREIEDSIQIYDCTVKTGSEVLDTVLTEKRLYCETHGINMTCVADGSKLGFLDPVDVYALFGNAIDNAIEAVSALSDAEQRLIAVSVWSSRGLLLIQCENYYGHSLTFEDGLPITTKARDGYHGFGIRSIRYTVEKYGGCMTVHPQNGLFVLRLSIPLL